MQLLTEALMVGVLWNSYRLYYYNVCLYRTRVLNKDDNEDTRQNQNNTLKYQSKQDILFFELVQTDDRFKNDN